MTTSTVETFPLMSTMPVAANFCVGVNFEAKKIKANTTEAHTDGSLLG